MKYWLLLCCVLLPVQSVQADAPQDIRCWNTCTTCELRCSRKTALEQQDCREQCWDTRANCCYINNKKPVFKGCGCY